MADSSVPHDDQADSDEIVAERLLQMLDGDLPSESGDSIGPDEFLRRVRRTQSLLQLIGREARDSTLDGADGQPTEARRSGRISDESDPLHRIGRFQILGELGRGGCGIVFRAHDPQLNREVALKVPHPGTMLSAESQRRFLRESLAAAALDHPNITPVHEAGEDNYLCYIASALCDGPTLAAWLQQRSCPPSPALSAQLVRILSGAVHHAHSRGVLHRDLKPGNVILSPTDGTRHASNTVIDPETGETLLPRLTDFGLARLEQSTDQSTVSGTVVGTLNYMAPEQAEGRSDLTTAVDIYSLGAILYELLTGRPPRQVTSHAGLLTAQQSESIPRIRDLRQSVPEDLETICLKCLNTAAEDRYASADAVENDLRRFMERQPILGRRLTGTQRLLGWYRRRPAQATLAISTTLLTVALIGGTILSAALLFREQRATLQQLASTQAANAELREANRRADIRTIEASLAQAERARISRSDGQRFTALAALRQAWQIAGSQKLDAQFRGRIQEELLACLSLPDLQIAAEWPGYDVFEADDAVAVSPDTSCFAMFESPTRVVVRDMRDGQILQELGVSHLLDDDSDNRAFEWARLRFSRDGRRLATSGVSPQTWAAGLPTIVWDIRSGRELISLTADGSFWADDVDFSPDGNHVAIGLGDGATAIYELDTGRVANRFASSEGLIPAQIVRYANESELLAVARHHTIEIWDVVVSVRIAQFSTSSPIKSLTWTPDDRYVCWSTQDAAAMHYGEAYGQSTHRIVQDSVTNVERFAFHPNGRVAAITSRSTTTLFDLNLQRPLLTVSGRASHFSTDGRYLAFSSGGRRIGRWSYEDGHECRLIACDSVVDGTSCLEFANDSALAVCCENGVRVFDTEHGKELVFLPGGPALSGTFPERQQELISVSAEGVQRWPMAGLETLEPFLSEGSQEIGAPDLPAPTFGCLDAGNDSMLVGYGDQRLRRICLSDGSVESVTEIPADCWTVAVDPRKHWVVTTNWDEQPSLRDHESLSEVRKLRGIRGRARFSHSGELLAIGNTEQTIIYSCDSWTVQHELAHSALEPGYGSLAFSPNDHVLAVAEPEGKVTLLDAADWQQLTQLTLPIPASVCWLEWSPSGKHLAACTDRGYICVWDLPRLSQSLEQATGDSALPF